MSFDDLMASVVGKAIIQEKELSGPWNEYKRTGEKSCLQEACSRGNGIPDTRLGVYYYSLVYQKQHYDALAMVLENAALPVRGRCLIVDFGAGPGTAALAWAAYAFRRTGTSAQLSYVHLDHLAAMEPLCEALFNSDSNLGPGLTWWSYRRAPMNTAHPARWVRDADHVVFIFSYVLCQRTVGPSSIAEFVRLIVLTCQELGNKPAYIIMVDANWSNSSWNSLIKGLRAAGFSFALTDPPPTLDYEAVYLNPDGTVRDSRDNAGRTMYDVVRLQ